MNSNTEVIWRRGDSAMPENVEHVVKAARSELSHSKQNPETAGTTMKDTIAQMLEVLANLYGVDMLMDTKRIKGVLAEVFRSDDYKKCRNLLGIALADMDAFARLKSLSGGEFLAAETLAAEMQEDFDILPTSANAVMEAVSAMAGSAVLRIEQPVTPIITSPAPANSPANLDAASITADMPVIEFGNYHWIVLKSERKRALLITANAVAMRDWPNKVLAIHNFDMRRYLNSTFLGTFDPSERKRIVKDDQKHELVFLLDAGEAVLYFHSDADRAAQHQGENCLCWLTDGYIQPSGGVVTYANKLPEFDSDKMSGGVRPAVWVRK